MGVLFRYLIPTLIAPYGGTSWGLACVLPPSAITMMVECILSAEVVQRGVTWGTLGVSAAVESSFTPALLFAILIFDILFYGLLTWYCDQVGCSVTSGCCCVPCCRMRVPWLISPNTAAAQTSHCVPCPVPGEGAAQ